MNHQQELRTKYLRAADNTKIAAILESAFDEDDREGGCFDAIGFSQFCPEDSPEDIVRAWRAYCSYRQELGTTVIQ
jgi:hypothetical protein